MKASETSLLNLIRQVEQFMVPIYQRTYSWTTKHCERLWEDIIRCGSKKKGRGHFVGSVVYIEDSDATDTAPSPRLVIDGQQRLTTVVLLIAALCERLKGKEGSGDLTEPKLRSYYLLNHMESGERKYRLLLSKRDRETLKSIVDGRTLPIDHSVRVKENYEWLKNKVVETRASEETIWRGLGRLLIVDLKLVREDDPQRIFDSMNSTGLELSQADRIRNFVLMNLPSGEQEILYTDHWSKVEEWFGQEAYDTLFDGFVRHYLTTKTGYIPNKAAIYEKFRDFSEDEDSGWGGNVRGLVEDLERFSRYYCAMELGKEEDPDLAKAFKRISEGLVVNVAYPFLLRLYEDYDRDILSKEDFLQILRLVESYVVRRAVSNLPTSALNKTFAAFFRGIDRENYLESVKAHFILLGGKQVFPNDQRFMEDLLKSNLYRISSRRFFWDNLENHGRRELGDWITIEHIMPQTLNDDWKAYLGEGWEITHEECLHTLGNLTLTGHNSELGARSFEEKKRLLEESPLRLNQSIKDVEKWDPSAMTVRGLDLAKRALEIWEIPQLPEDILAPYRERRGGVGRSLEDLPYYQRSNVKGLFHSLQKEILELDTAAVDEEVRKHYVAYKIDGSNFVSVVLRESWLLLYLNVQRSKLQDPSGLSTNVSGKGHQGTGDVEVKLQDKSVLPEVMALVRQSFERRQGIMDDEDDEE